MAICDLLSKGERRSGVANPAQWLIDWVHGERSGSGVSVTPETGLKYSPVWAAVNIISQSVASLPFVVYRRMERGKDRARTHRNWRLLGEQANPYMDALTFRQVLQGHVLTWGNGYAEIERDGAGRPLNLWPLAPDLVEPAMKGNRLTYEVKNRKGGSGVVLDPADVLHIKAYSSNGYQGLSPIRQHREAIGLGRAAEEFGAAFFGNGASPGGVLQHPEALNEKARDNLRASWERMHKGLDNAHRIAILEEGMTWQQIGIPPDDAQFLETRKFQVTEVARIYQIPPHMLGDLERATFSNIEHQSIDFVRHTLMPWLRRWELECNRKLFGPWSTNFFGEFLVEGLLRGDSRARGQFYRELWNLGVLSANEIREKENLNPIAGGDRYWVPVNMAPADRPTALPPGPPDPDEDDDDDTSDSPADKPDGRAHRELLVELARRIVTKEINAMRTAAKRQDFCKAVERFYGNGNHAAHVAEVLTPAARAYAEAIGLRAAETRAAVVAAMAQLAIHEANAARRALADGPQPERVLAEWQLSRPAQLADHVMNTVAEVARAPACLLAHR